MNRLYKLVACLLMLLMLAGCAAPYYEPPDPYPYSFTDTSKELYPETTAGARRFVSDARILWIYETNNIVLPPDFCATYFRGDCDDFATMLAYYLQEYWRYDTYIVFIRDTREGFGDHAVTFAYPNDGLVDFRFCTLQPLLNDQGKTYYPLDWTECPGWMWYSYGGTKYYTPAAWIYSYYLHDWYLSRDGGFLEWYEMVHSMLSVSPPEPCADPFDRPLPSPTTVLGESFR
jgi:hypothetical protein